MNNINVKKRRDFFRYLVKYKTYLKYLNFEKLNISYKVKRNDTQMTTFFKKTGKDYQAFQSR